MRILVVSAAVPFPPRGGGRMRTYQLCRALREEHEVTVLAFVFEGEVAPSVEPPFIVETVPWIESADLAAMKGSDPDASVEAVARLAAADAPPWFASYYESSLMDEAVRRLSSLHDVVLFEGSDMALFRDAVPDGVRVVVDLMDVYSLMARRAASTANGEDEDSSREADRVLRFERDVVARADLCLAVSEKEADVARTLLGAVSVEVVANGVDTLHFGLLDPAGARPGEIVFTGSLDYLPNIEGVQFFAREIWPLILDEMPQSTFRVAGASPGPEILALDGDRVSVHANVPDMRPMLEGAQVVVVPLLSGGGTRLKILEAASAGRALVSTSLGAEGLDFEPGRDILIADDPRRFAQQVLFLLRNEAEREKLVVGARSVALRYDWREVGRDLLRSIKRLA